MGVTQIMYLILMSLSMTGLPLGPPGLTGRPGIYQSPSHGLGFDL